VSRRVISVNMTLRGSFLCLLGYVVFWIDLPARQAELPGKKHLSWSRITSWGLLATWLFPSIAMDNAGAHALLRMYAHTEEEFAKRSKHSRSG